MKKTVIAMLVAVCVVVGLAVAFAPIPFPMENPTNQQCDRMTTSALFQTVLQSTRTTNLAYIDPWPKFLEDVAEHYYPLRALSERDNADAVISAYIAKTEGDDAVILEHLKAECLLNHVRAVQGK